MNLIIDEKIIKNLINSSIIIVVSMIIYFILKGILLRLFSINKSKVNPKQKKTIENLLINILKYFIIIVVCLMILNVFGVDTKTLVASFGILGLVAGLAIQDTLKDFISGVTIILENQYRVGDTVTINDFKGEVLALGIKTTRIRSYTGEIMIIPNHLITHVINYSLEKTLAIVDISVSYDSDIEKVEKILKQYCLDAKIEGVKNTPQYLGINKMADSALEFRIVADSIPMQHFMVERQMKKEIKLLLDKNDIVIPYPQVVVHNGKKL